MSQPDGQIWTTPYTRNSGSSDLAAGTMILFLGEKKNGGCCQLSLIDLCYVHKTGVSLPALSSCFPCASWPLLLLPGSRAIMGMAGVLA